MRDLVYVVANCMRRSVSDIEHAYIIIIASHHHRIITASWGVLQFRRETRTSCSIDPRVQYAHACVMSDSRLSDDYV